MVSTWMLAFQLTNKFVFTDEKANIILWILDIQIFLDFWHHIGVLHHIFKRFNDEEGLEGETNYSTGILVCGMLPNGALMF
ncbi:hypothetical protein LINPERHAP1_LOCUS26617 [Linum perenne]